MNKNENLNNEEEMIDISSKSKNFGNKAKYVFEVTDKYSESLFKNLGNIVKAIGFILCFLTIILSLVVAFFLFSSDKFNIVLSMAILLVGVIIGLIILFLIYGMGQIICQNDEIIDRLKRK